MSRKRTRVEPPSSIFMWDITEPECVRLLEALARYWKLDGKNARPQAIQRCLSDGVNRNMRMSEHEPYLAVPCVRRTHHHEIPWPETLDPAEGWPKSKDTPRVSGETRKWSRLKKAVPSKTIEPKVKPERYVCAPTRGLGNAVLHLAARWGVSRNEAGRRCLWDGIRLNLNAEVVYELGANVISLLDDIAEEQGVSRADLCARMITEACYRAKTERLKKGNIR